MDCVCAKMNLVATGMSLSMESRSWGPKRRATAESHNIVPNETLRNVWLRWGGGGWHTDVRAWLPIARLLVEEHGDGEEGDATEPGEVAEGCERFAADVHWIAGAEDANKHNMVCSEI
jgi:hypothetical protein